MAVTRYEAAHGARFFSSKRLEIDRTVERLVFIVAHVDFAAFLKEEVHIVLTRISHAIAHLSLRVVRAVERLLTRVVRRLRIRHATIAGRESRENAREFVKTLSDFKDTLQTGPQDVSEFEPK